VTTSCIRGWGRARATRARLDRSRVEASTKLPVQTVHRAHQGTSARMARASKRHASQASTRREVPPPASCAVQTTCTAREDPQRAAATSAGQAVLPRVAQPRHVTRVQSAGRGIHATAPLIRPHNVPRGLSRPRAVSIAPPAETTTCSAASVLASVRCVALEASQAAGAPPLARRVPRVRRDPNAPAPVCR
jgi:hypothetical protein